MKIRSKMVLGLYSLLIPVVLFTTPTFAYDHNVGANVIHDWEDEFTIDTNTVASSTATFTKDNLALGDFTILFYDSVGSLTVPLNTGVEILIGGQDFNYYYSENVSLSVDHYLINYSLISGTTSIAELQGFMIYVEGFNNMETPGDFAIRLHGVNYNMQTFMETWAYIIYDTPSNIIANTIDYYYADGESEGYVSGAEAGYQDGQDDMFAQGSTNFGYNVVDAFDYDLGYNTGYDDAIDEPVEASSIQFMEDFKNWILPALLLVILVGGAFSVIAKKKRDDE